MDRAGMGACQQELHRDHPLQQGKFGLTSCAEGTHESYVNPLALFCGKY